MTPLHHFKFTVYFEREKRFRQRKEKFEIDADSGMVAWIELLNHFRYETTTGRMVKVDLKVD